MVTQGFGFFYGAQSLSAAGKEVEGGGGGGAGGGAGGEAAIQRTSDRGGRSAGGRAKEGGGGGGGGGGAGTDTEGDKAAGRGQGNKAGRDKAAGGKADSTPSQASSAVPAAAGKATAKAVAKAAESKGAEASAPAAAVGRLSHASGKRSRHDHEDETPAPGLANKARRVGPGLGGSEVGREGEGGGNAAAGKDDSAAALKAKEAAAEKAAQGSPPHVAFGGVGWLVLGAGRRLLSGWLGDSVGRLFVERQATVCSDVKRAVRSPTRA